MPPAREAALRAVHVDLLVIRLREAGRFWVDQSAKAEAADAEAQGLRR